MPLCGRAGHPISKCFRGKDYGVELFSWKSVVLSLRDWMNVSSGDSSIIQITIQGSELLRVPTLRAGIETWTDGRFSERHLRFHQDATTIIWQDPLPLYTYLCECGYMSCKVTMGPRLSAVSWPSSTENVWFDSTASYFLHPPTFRSFTPFLLEPPTPHLCLPRRLD